MSMDIHKLSADLLERLANSIYDRDPTTRNPLFFSLKEIHIVENWLRELAAQEEYCAEGTTEINQGDYNML